MVEEKSQQLVNVSVHVHVYSYLTIYKSALIGIQHTPRGLGLCREQLRSQGKQVRLNHFRSKWTPGALLRHWEKECLHTLKTGSRTVEEL